MEGSPVSTVSGTPLSNRVHTVLLDRKSSAKAELRLDASALVVAEGNEVILPELRGRAELQALSEQRAGEDR